MKDLSVIVSIASHAIFNPLLFRIVRRSLEFHEENQRASTTPDHTASSATENRGINASTAQGYLARTIISYAFFMLVVYGVLSLLRLTPDTASFIDVQFNYSSPWRTAIVAVMATRIYFWATQNRPWLVIALLLPPLVAAAAIVQIILFFRHLY